MEHKLSIIPPPPDRNLSGRAHFGSYYGVVVLSLRLIYMYLQLRYTTVSLLLSDRLPVSLFIMPRTVLESATFIMHTCTCTLQ